jgi:hypothetical protein
MPVPTLTYQKELQKLKLYLADAMKSYVPENSFNAARVLAEEIAPLIEGQLQVLAKAAIRLQEADPVRLRDALGEFAQLLPNSGDQEIFQGYKVMMDSLITEPPK